MSGEGFQLPSPRQSITDAGSTVPMFSRTWYLFFQQVFARIGGVQQFTNNDLAQAPTGIDWSAVIMTQGDAQALRTEASELRAFVTELARSFADLQQSDDIKTLRSLVAEQAKAIFDLQQVTK